MKHTLILTLAATAFALASCAKSEEYKAADEALNQYEKEIGAATECIGIGEATANALEISQLVLKVTDAREQKKLSVRYKKIAEKAQKKAEKLCLPD